MLNYIQRYVVTLSCLHAVCTVSCCSIQLLQYLSCIPLTVALHVVHKQIAHTKAMVQKLLCDRGVLVVIDVHAHSRKDGCFMYGCISDRASTPDTTTANAAATTTNSSNAASTTTTAAAGGVSRGTISSRGDAAAAAAGATAAAVAAATAAATTAAAVTEAPRERMQWRYSQAHRNMAVRLFPRIMAKLCAPFRLDHCNNKMGAGRAYTMRVVSTHMLLVLQLLVLLY
jgi:hypothetical protein